MRVVVQCPAKVNLFLSVGPRDAVGYHPLRTIFQTIGLYDTVTVSSAESATTIHSDWGGLPGENTLTKVLRLAAEVVTVPPLEVMVEKRIPAGSGLGGGSSDAAGLLRALQHFVVQPLSPNTLHDIAAAVGSDVPFFLVAGRARGEGYGERLSPMPYGHPEWYVVAKPDVSSSTADAYAKLDALSYEWRSFPDGDELYNDFERVADCASLELMERLKVHGARDAGLTGSGSAVFGRFGDSREKAELAADLLRSEGCPHVWVAPTLGRTEAMRLRVS